MASTRPRALDVVIAVLVVAVGAAAWWRLGGSSAVQAPPEPWRCDLPGAEADCFVPVGGGRFWMGAQADDPEGPGHDPAATPEEGPVHEVTVSPFWLQRGEVTVGLYRRCVREGACDASEVASGEGFLTWRPLQLPDEPLPDALPLNGVSWEGARQVCAWLGGRLPTEAEWELAATGGDGRRWPWGDRPVCPLGGDDPVTGAPRTSCAQDGPHQVNDLPGPSPFGLHAMAGNLWEWTLDGYAPDAYARHAAIDPLTPAAEVRAQRGGGWTAETPEEVRTTVRGGMEVGARLPDVGARCAWGGGAG